MLSTIVLCEPLSLSSCIFSLIKGPGAHFLPSLAALLSEVQKSKPGFFSIPLTAVNFCLRPHSAQVTCNPSP